MRNFIKLKVAVISERSEKESILTGKPEEEDWCDITIEKNLIVLVRQFADETLTGCIIGFASGLTYRCDRTYEDMCEIILRHNTLE